MVILEQIVSYGPHERYFANVWESPWGGDWCDFLNYITAHIMLIAAALCYRSPAKSEQE